MQESISEKSKFSFFKIKNYWRNIDKQILVSFFLLFILGSFFSFSSTSFLADERLSKEYYFFFSKAPFICKYFFLYNDFYIST